ncbi:MAG: ROK family transcriptional regulator [Stappiaceae bacterium]
MKPVSKLAIVGSNAERTRLHNRQVVLGLVRQHQPVGRAEIARFSGLSTQAVSNITAELEKDGFLNEAGREVRGRGLPATQYALNSGGAFGVGIEVRPEVMFGTLVNLGGETVKTKRVALKSSAPHAVSVASRKMLDDLLIRAGVKHEQLLGAGVVMPGPFGDVGLSGTGQSELMDWDGVDATQTFEKALELPVIIENDATAAAVAEKVSGVAKDLNSYCYIYFGTGLGLGVVADGQVLRGAFGNAGELGHIVVAPNGHLCACGNRGCLETYASRLSVRNHLEKSGLSVQSVKDLEKLHLAGHPDLASWLQSAAPPLSQAIGMIENLFDPEAVIIGGAMPDNLLDHLIGLLTLPSGSVARRTGRPVERVLRGASGRMAAALGGAALIIHNTFTPRIVARA